VGRPTSPSVSRREQPRQTCRARVEPGSRSDAREPRPGDTSPSGCRRVLRQPSASSATSVTSRRGALGADPDGSPMSGQATRRAPEPSAGAAEPAGPVDGPSPAMTEDLPDRRRAQAVEPRRVGSGRHPERDPEAAPGPRRGRAAARAAQAADPAGRRADRRNPEGQRRAARRNGHTAARPRRRRSGPRPRRPRPLRPRPRAAPSRRRGARALPSNRPRPGWRWSSRRRARCPRTRPSPTWAPRQACRPPRRCRSRGAGRPHTGVRGRTRRTSGPAHSPASSSREPAQAQRVRRRGLRGSAGASGRTSVVGHGNDGHRSKAR
jgi:hypothetical protein